MNGWTAVIVYIAVNGTVQTIRAGLNYKAGKRRDDARKATP